MPPARSRNPLKIARLRAAFGDSRRTGLVHGNRIWGNTTSAGFPKAERHAHQAGDFVVASDDSAWPPLCTSQCTCTTMRTMGNENTVAESASSPGLAWHAEDSADVLAHLEADGERGLTRRRRDGGSRGSGQTASPISRRHRSGAWCSNSSRASSSSCYWARPPSRGPRRAHRSGGHPRCPSPERCHRVRRGMARAHVARPAALLVGPSRTRPTGRPRPPPAERRAGARRSRPARAGLPGAGRWTALQERRASVSESALTGESDAVEKDARATARPGHTARAAPDDGLPRHDGARRQRARRGDRHGSGHRAGSDRSARCAGGRRTTPLERQVEALGRRLMVLALVICGSSVWQASSTASPSA